MGDTCRSQKKRFNILFIDGLQIDNHQNKLVVSKDEFLEQIKRIAREEITNRIARLKVRPYNDAGARAVC